MYCLIAREALSLCRSFGVFSLLLTILGAKFWYQVVLIATVSPLLAQRANNYSQIHFGRGASHSKIIIVLNLKSGKDLD